MDLIGLTDSFLNERIETRRMTLRQATRFRLYIIGEPSALHSIGFVHFLKASGVKNPGTEHFDGHYVGRHWEYLAQNVGLLHAARAMHFMRVFWRWCVNNEQIKNQPMPPDLVDTRPANFYRVHMRIREKRARS